MTKINQIKMANIVFTAGKDMYHFASMHNQHSDEAIIQAYMKDIKAINPQMPMSEVAIRAGVEIETSHSIASGNGRATRVRSKLNKVVPQVVPSTVMEF
ncbi:hypothetical protein [Colwellia sp. TT2012]|uniref:hypothetical protein n=1 Tax=Colwellia sp. TT2012 TaxID=1720342 RepID=UPI000A897DFB|nr:hypothetical protein [Colwellia sp. TT2012]